MDVHHGSVLFCLLLDVLFQLLGPFWLGFAIGERRIVR
jgi:hypothetical protein